MPLTVLPEKSQTETCQPETLKVIYVKSDNRIFRLDISRISYIEGLGDYVKIYSKDEPKPVLSLCTMKYMEEKLPSDEFIRVHRSFIIRKDCIRIIESSKIALDKLQIVPNRIYGARYLSGRLVQGVRDTFLEYKTLLFLLRLYSAYPDIQMFGNGYLTVHNIPR